MSLRGRLTVAGAGAVFVALAIASSVIYFAVRSNLQEQLDASLIQLAEGVASKWNVENTLQSAKAPFAKSAVPEKFGAHGYPPSPGALFGSDGTGGYEQVVPNISAATKRGAIGAGSGQDPSQPEARRVRARDRPGRVGGERDGAPVLSGHSLSRRADAAVHDVALVRDATA